MLKLIGLAFSFFGGGFSWLWKFLVSKPLYILLLLLAISIGANVWFYHIHQADSRVITLARANCSLQITNVVNASNQKVLEARSAATARMKAQLAHLLSIEGQAAQHQQDQTAVLTNALVKARKQIEEYTHVSSTKVWSNTTPPVAILRFLRAQPVKPPAPQTSSN